MRLAAHCLLFVAGIAASGAGVQVKAADDNGTGGPVKQGDYWSRHWDWHDNHYVPYYHRAYGTAGYDGYLTPQALSNGYFKNGYYGNGYYGNGGIGESDFQPRYLGDDYAAPARYGRGFEDFYPDGAYEPGPYSNPFPRPGYEEYYRAARGDVPNRVRSGQPQNNWR